MGRPSRAVLKCFGRLLAFACVSCKGSEHLRPVPTIEQWTLQDRGNLYGTANLQAGDLTQWNALEDEILGDAAGAAVSKGVQAARRALLVQSSKKNPYGARYNLYGEAVNMPLRGLAEGSTSRTHAGQRSGDRRKKGRRKGKNARKQRPTSGATGEIGGSSEGGPRRIPGREGEVDELQSSDSKQPMLRGPKPKVPKEAAGYDSAALEEHVANDDIEQHKAWAKGETEPSNATHVVSGEGQFGLGGKEAAGGRDSSGVQEHFDQDPTVLTGVRFQNDTQLDASGAHMPKGSRAAGVDSSGVSGHIAEDVGEGLVDHSGSTKDLVSKHGHPRDASDREVAAKIGEQGSQDGASFDQEAISELADDVTASADDVGDTEISAAGVMPSNWAASPLKTTISAKDSDRRLEDDMQDTDGII